MMIKKLIKKINRTIGRWAMNMMLVVAKIIPRQFLYAYVQWIIMLVSYYTGSRLVQVARDNIKDVFGDRKTIEEQALLVKASFKNLALVIAESIDCVARPARFLAEADIEGEAHLTTALQKGKGVIAVTAHLGNFPAMMGFFAARGYQVNVLVKPSRDPKMSEFIVRKFKSFGGNIIFSVPQRACVQSSIKALRANQVLFILIDQNYGADARIFVDFLGRKAATGASPVAFARRTGASVLPIFSVRRNGKMHIIVDPEVELKQPDKDNDCIQENMQMLTNIVEDYVRHYPGIWSWTHKRWKCKNNVLD